MYDLIGFKAFQGLFVLHFLYIKVNGLKLVYKLRAYHFILLGFYSEGLVVGRSMYLSLSLIFEVSFKSLHFLILS